MIPCLTKLYDFKWTMRFMHFKVLTSLIIYVIQVAKANPSLVL